MSDNKYKILGLDSVGRIIILIDLEKPLKTFIGTDLTYLPFYINKNEQRGLVYHMIPFNGNMGMPPVSGSHDTYEAHAYRNGLLGLKYTTQSVIDGEFVKYLNKYSFTKDDEIKIFNETPWMMKYPSFHDICINEDYKKVNSEDEINNCKNYFKETDTNDIAGPMDGEMYSIVINDVLRLKILESLKHKTPSTLTQYKINKKIGAHNIFGFPINDAMGNERKKLKKKLRRGRYPPALKNLADEILPSYVDIFLHGESLSAGGSLETPAKQLSRIKEEIKMLTMLEMTAGDSLETPAKQLSRIKEEIKMLTMLEMVASKKKSKKKKSKKKKSKRRNLRRRNQRRNQKE